MSPIGLFHHEDCGRHDPGWGHPEHQGRLRAVMQGLDRAWPELRERVEIVRPASATVETLELVHASAHVERLREASRRAAAAGGGVRLDPDTVVSGASWDAALAASGCVVEAVRAVGEGRFPAAFCAIRPPGHHATADRAMGFCLVNHVALGARIALAEGIARRVLIVDWDVHHGNGTQEIFYEDADVFYLSLHQQPLFPGTGAESERGRGPGEGTTRNLPLPPGLPPAEYVDALAEAAVESIEIHGPDLVLISAGFDAAAGDPLAGFTLEAEHFARLTREIAGRAPRTVSSLEGGYDPRRLGALVLAHVETLAEVYETSNANRGGRT